MHVAAKAKEAPHRHVAKAKACYLRPRQPHGHVAKATVAPIGMLWPRLRHAVKAKAALHGHAAKAKAAP
nr:hypothetical protein CFP56_07145 [Quercus suber]